jgi:small-conductance mechanosensitive channel
MSEPLCFLIAHPIIKKRLGSVILVRRPYGIGDFIHVGGIETDGSFHGALPWCVTNVTLFETELVFAPSNERASLSNGSLANCRIINWARSPQAQFHIFLEFPMETPYYKLEQFKLAVEEYIKARPREWRALNGFRVSMVYASRNYIEHTIVVQ